MVETCDDNCGGVIAGFSAALVIVVVISVILNVILFAQLRKKTRSAFTYQGVCHYFMNTV